jgi:ABC-2 type transport system permease protein
MPSPLRNDPAAAPSAAAIPAGAGPDLWRYALSLRRFWGTALAAELEYPANAWIELIAVLGNLAGSLFLLQLLFAGGSSLGGWSWRGALVVLGIYTLLDGLTSCVLQPNLSRIVNQVQSGSLDFVLLKPIDSQFWLSTRNVSPWGLPALLAGLGLIGWALSLPGGEAAGAAALLLGVLLLLAACAILYSLWFVLAALSIWFVKVWNATEVLRYTLVAGRYPLSSYPPALRLLFTFVLPVAFLTTVPAEALLGRAAPLWALGSLLAAVFCLGGSRLLWIHAQRHYTSASS